ncbi:MAG: NAD-binding protein [Spirochaetales bacterium]|nr:NAD-binding protein [Spirochaetales bacterium]
MRVKNHILICGWNSKGKFIIDEIQNKYAKKIGHIGLIAEINSKPVDNWRIFFINGNPANDADLDRANVYKADTVIILADYSRGLNEEDLDGQSLLVAQKIRRINPRVYICVELINTENRYFAELAKVNEVFLTNEISGQLISQSVQNRGLLKVYSELLSNSYGKYLEKIKAPDFTVDLNFDQALIELRKKNKMILLGIESRGQIILNPRDTYIIEEYDFLFIISQGRN